MGELDSPTTERPAAVPVRPDKYTGRHVRRPRHGDIKSGHPVRYINGRLEEERSARDFMNSPDQRDISARLAEQALYGFQRTVDLHRTIAGHPSTEFIMHEPTVTLSHVQRRDYHHY